MLGDADEIDILLDVICNLEGHLLLPWTNAMFGQVVKEGAVCGCDVCGVGRHVGSSFLSISYSSV